MMQIFDSHESYGLISKIFHSLRLIILIAIYTITKLSFLNIPFNFHKTLGVLMFFIILSNIAWRILNPYPKVESVNVVEKNITFIVWFSIYILLALAPLTGYLMSYACINMFNLFSIPSVYDSDVVKNYIINNIGMPIYALTNLMAIIHHFIVEVLLIFLIAIHILAVFYSIVFRKKKELGKMFNFNNSINK
jgi:cytochrome b561